MRSVCGTRLVPDECSYANIPKSVKDSLIRVTAFKALVKLSKCFKVGMILTFEASVTKLISNAIP